MILGEIVGHVLTDQGVSMTNWILAKEVKPGMTVRSRKTGITMIIEKVEPGRIHPGGVAKWTYRVPGIRESVSRTREFAGMARFDLITLMQPPRIPYSEVQCDGRC